MSRTLSATGLASMLANETAEEWIILLTISHVSFSTVRLARRSINIVSNGETFNSRYFELTWPDQTPNNIPQWQLSLDIVDQAVLAELRAITTPPTVRIDLIRASSPDTIEMTTGDDYKLRNMRYISTTMTAEISMEDLLDEGFPSGRILPSNFPGGF